MATGESSSTLELPVGEKGSPVKPIVEAFKAKGVSIPEQTISNLRGNWQSGEVTINRIKCAEKLTQDDASLKNNLYLEIAKKALELRTPQKRYTHRFDTNYYMEDIAEQLGQDQHDVAKLIRAMRADLVSTDPDNPNLDQGLVTLFLGLAQRYIRDYTSPYPSSASPPIKALDQDWNHRTIKDYYRVLSQRGSQHGVRAITTWIPYEMEAMARFYEGQIASGNHLTPFDRKILGVILDKNESDRDLAAQIRVETGVNVAHNVIESHRNCLVYGSPVSVLIARKS